MDMFCTVEYVDLSTKGKKKGSKSKSPLAYPLLIHSIYIQTQSIRLTNTFQIENSVSPSPKTNLTYQNGPLLRNLLPLRCAGRPGRHCPSTTSPGAFIFCRHDGRQCGRGSGPDAQQEGNQDWRQDCHRGGRGGRLGRGYAGGYGCCDGSPSNSLQLCPRYSHCSPHARYQGQPYSLVCRHSQGLAYPGEAGQQPSVQAAPHRRSSEGSASSHPSLNQIYCQEWLVSPRKEVARFLASLCF